MSVIIKNSRSVTTETPTTVVFGSLAITDVSAKKRIFFGDNSSNPIEIMNKIPLVLAVSNKATGGSIGSAASTVDIYDKFDITQTTANQTITLASPTSSSNKKIVYIENTGSTSFTIYGVVLAINTFICAIWDGAQWAIASGGSGGSSTLAGLSDVQITSPLDQNVLQYNTTSGKWENHTLYNTTSTTSQQISSNSKQFTLADKNLLYAVGDIVKVSYDVSNYMYGIVTAYDSTAYTITISFYQSVGSGIYTNWTVQFAGSSATSSSNKYSIVSRDFYSNFATNAVITSYSEITTAGGTTTLTLASARRVRFIGTTTQTGVLLDATTTINSDKFEFINNSTGIVTIQDNGNNVLATIQANSQIIVVLTNNSTSNGVWSIISSGITGSGTSGQIAVFNGANSLTSAVLTAGGTKIFAQTTIAGGDTIANSTSETAFTASNTLSANSVSVGDVFTCNLSGVFSTAVVAPSLTIKIKLGSTTMLSTGSFTTIAGISNLGWYTEAKFTVQSIGSSGSIEAQGSSAFSTAAAAAMTINMSNTSALTIDTTASQAITATIQWSSASASNTITVREFFIQKLTAQGSPVGINNSQTLSNKTLDNSNIITVQDANLIIQDNIDTTKQAQFQLSGITTATTRTYTLPNRNGTIADDTDLATKINIASGSFNAFTRKTTIVDADIITGEDSANSFSKIKILASDLWTYISTKSGTFTNKILSDSTTYFGNVSDTTKKFVFSLGGATTAKTLTLASSHTNDRTITLPDATTTLVGTDTTQTLTNKSIVATQLTGTLAAGQFPALTGDVTTTAGSLATTVGKINGTSLSGLSTGLLKNTTTTGVPSIAVAGTDYLAPAPGAISPYAAATAPTGYLLCNGSTISRTTYSALFAIIGTTFGVGDGSTTFAIPDLRGYFIRGLDTTLTIDKNNASGSTTNGSARTLGSTQANDNLNHSHTITGQNGSSLNPYLAPVLSSTPQTAIATSNAGGSESRPVNIALNYIIKY